MPELRGRKAHMVSRYSLFGLNHIIAKVIFESSNSCKAAEEVAESMIAKSTMDNPEARRRELRHLEFLQGTSANSP